METMKAIARRKSTRSYKQDQIPDEALNTILAAGCAAPVALGQYDSLHLTVIQNKEKLNNISAGIAKAMNTENGMSYGAPTIVLVSSKDTGLPCIDYANTGCVLENMMIAATDQKVDSVLLGAAALAVNTDAELRKVLAIPDEFIPIVSVALGYAAVPDETEKVLKVTINMNRV